MGPRFGPRFFCWKSDVFVTPGMRSSGLLEQVRRGGAGCGFSFIFYGPWTPPENALDMVRFTLLMLKACVCWQWSQHLHRQCLQQGKEPLLLNLDETSVPVCSLMGKVTLLPIAESTLGERCHGNDRAVRTCMHASVCSRTTPTNGFLIVHLG